MKISYEDLLKRREKLSDEIKTMTPVDNVCIVQKYHDSEKVLELRKEFDDSKAFIIRAVNSHEALLKAVKACGLLASRYMWVIDQAHIAGDTKDEAHKCVGLINKAIAQAEEK